MKRWRRKQHRRWIGLLCSAQFILKAKTIELVVHFWCTVAVIVAILVIAIVVIIIISIVVVVVVVVIVVPTADVQIVFATIIIVVVINGVGGGRSTAASVADGTLGWFLFNDEILIFIFDRIVRRRCSRFLVIDAQIEWLVVIWLMQ